MPNERQVYVECGCLHMECCIHICQEAVYLCLSFWLCMCIVKALTENSRPVSSINSHPYHLIQLHPLWTQALSKCHRDDYDNFATTGQTMLGEANGEGGGEFAIFIYKKHEFTHSLKKLLHIDNR